MNNNQQQRQWKAQNSGSNNPRWEPHKYQVDPNNFPAIEGYFTAFTEINGGQNGPFMVTEITTINPDGSIGESFDLSGGKVLENTMKETPLNSYVRIVYEGKKQAKTGGRTYNDYKVAVDEGAVPFNKAYPHLAGAGAQQAQRPQNPPAGQQQQAPPPQYSGYQQQAAPQYQQQAAPPQQQQYQQPPQYQQPTQGGTLQNNTQFTQQAQPQQPYAQPATQNVNPANNGDWPQNLNQSVYGANPQQQAHTPAAQQPAGQPFDPNKAVPAQPVRTQAAPPAQQQQYQQPAFNPNANNPFGNTATGSVDSDWLPF